MSYLKSKLATPLQKYAPLVKYGVVGLCASTWLYALVDQLYTSAHVMKYLLMSLILFAIALM
ncbi:MAG TPA: hypothetical protein VMH84_10555 [Xanthobacteraceae bacterium]|nr:hypothetical protein [Xanthobacteraceae bacterium]